MQKKHKLPNYIGYSSAEVCAIRLVVMSVLLVLLVFFMLLVLFVFAVPWPVISLMNAMVAASWPGFDDACGAYEHADEHTQEQQALEMTIHDRESMLTAIAEQAQRTFFPFS